MGSGSNIMGAFSSDSTLSTPVAIDKGGTGQITAQAAIDALTNVSAASANEVLTKDGSGNATFQTAGGGGKLELLTSSVLTGTASDMSSSFTSINGADLASIVVMFDLKTSVSADFYMQFSSASSYLTSSYYTGMIDTAGNTTTYGNQAAWLILDNPDNRRQCGEVQIYIPDSTQTASTADPMMFSNACDTNGEGQIAGGTNNSSTYSIDGVKIYPASGSLQVGSRLAVYKKANS